MGGTDLKVGLVQGPIAAGHTAVLDLQRLPTPRDAENPGDAVVDKIVELTQQYRRSHPAVRLAALGVTVPGLVDEGAGVGIRSSNLGWKNYPFTGRLRAQLGLPVAFGHDVGMAGEAEFRVGAARGARDVIVLVIGTGIAAAVFADGVRVAGGGYAGELGHAMVPAPDGSLQIFESVGSAGAVARRYGQASGLEADDGARGVLRLARAGDAVAQRVWSEAVDAIAFSISQCASILGIDTVVLGGGLAEAGDELFSPLASRLDQLLTVQRRPRIVPAALGQNAGLIGSALKARSLLAEAAAGTTSGPAGNR
ncbi:ROK family protein [Paenarthrobacter sp. Z7-10]|nr:ROK family protein [Paenarthrobacter sp. Z7-10]